MTGSPRIIDPAVPVPGPHAAVRRVENWLRDEAFPFWSDVGIDREGPGFVEHLTLEGAPAPVDFKRVRVQARQIYCFCQAAVLGWQPATAIALAEGGVDLLLRQAWYGPEGGWAATLTRRGDVLDPIPDLYDIAFVLFALGWWHRATGDPRVIGLAGQTLDFLDASMRHPSGEGYRHRLRGEIPHLQNPHMHLAEAMIVLRDATGRARFAAEADRMVALCLDRFFDPVSGSLAEEFDASWERHHGAGLRIEPGHHYEWVWLLKEHGARAEPGQAMRRLFDFAVAHGQSAATDLVVDTVLPDGHVSGPDHRLWPQAERLKAWLAMAERSGVDPRSSVAAGVDGIFTHFLDTSPRGTWIEHRTAGLLARTDKIPASSFYHLVSAFSEILRQRHLLGAP